MVGLPAQDQSPFVADVITSASAALCLPVRSAWNDQDVIEVTGFTDPAGAYEAVMITAERAAALDRRGGS